MIYFIGGGARCGKTMLAKKLQSKLSGAAYLSGDSFRTSLRPILPILQTSGADASDPTAYIEYYKERTEQAIDEAMGRADALWQFIESYAAAYMHESSGDLIIEGVDILPYLVSQSSFSYQAIFLVDTDPQQWKRVASHPGENDWIAAKGLTTEQVAAWASYSALRGHRIISGCHKHGYEFEDLTVHGFEAAQDSALQKLIQAGLSQA